MKKKYVLPALFFVLVAIFLAALFNSHRAAASSAEFEHVVVITVDGMCNELIDAVKPTNINTLIREGVYFPNALSADLHSDQPDPNHTLPRHSSLVSGMNAGKHRIFGNPPGIGAETLQGPTVFDLVQSSAIIAGKNKFEWLDPGHRALWLIATRSDGEVRTDAVSLIQSGLPQFTLIHFPDVDARGHSYGWLSDQQKGALLGFTDNYIGEIVEAIKKNGYSQNTLLIVTADHCGTNKGHNDNPHDIRIPWIAWGRGVTGGSVIYRNIFLRDTATVVAQALGYQKPERWDGVEIPELYTP